MWESVLIFLAVCAYKRQQCSSPTTTTLELFGLLLTGELNRLDLIWERNFRCQSAPSSSDESHLHAAIAKFIIVTPVQIIKKWCFWLQIGTFQLQFEQFCSAWHFSFQTEQWKATMRYLGKAIALCIDWAKAQHPLTKKRLKYQTCLRHLWSLWPQPMLKWSTYIIVHLCKLHWVSDSAGRERSAVVKSTLRLHGLMQKGLVWART